MDLVTTRIYWNGVVALLCAVAGCDLVYDLHRPADAGPGEQPYERCGPFLYQEPLRYTLIGNPNWDDFGAKAWSWNDARTACLQRGMDLAVFNDEHELGAEPEDVIWPYWMGASRTGATWSSVDGCPAMMPATFGPDSCGIVSGPNAIAGVSCTGAMPDPQPEQAQVVAAALCETPRPEDGPCLGNDPAKTEYVMSPTAMSFAAARTFCSDRGGRPVVFETHAEWLAVAKKIDDELHNRFWLGSTFDGTTWKTENKCPAQYAWASGSPSEAPHTDDCMGSVMLEVPVDGEQPRSVLTGVDRMECSSADMFALCEI